MKPKVRRKQSRNLGFAFLVLTSAAVGAELEGGPYGPVLYDVASATIVTFSYESQVPSPRGCEPSDPPLTVPYLVTFANGEEDWLLGNRTIGCNPEELQINATNRFYGNESPVVMALRALVADSASHNSSASAVSQYEIVSRQLERKAGLARILPGDCDQVILELEKAEQKAKDAGRREWLKSHPDNFPPYAGDLDGGRNCYPVASGDVAVIRVRGMEWEGRMIYPELGFYSRDFLESRRMNDQGFNQYKLKNYDKAIVFFGRAKTLDPKYVNAILNLASVFALTGMSEQAVENLLTANRIDPKFTRARIRSDKDFASILSDSTVLEILKTSHAPPVNTP